jgi:hypothetical protein
MSDEPQPPDRGEEPRRISREELQLVIRRAAELLTDETESDERLSGGAAPPAAASTGGTARAGWWGPGSCPAVPTRSWTVSRTTS